MMMMEMISMMTYDEYDDEFDYDGCENDDDYANNYDGCDDGTALGQLSGARVHLLGFGHLFGFDLLFVFGHPGTPQGNIYNTICLIANSPD